MAAAPRLLRHLNTTLEAAPNTLRNGDEVNLCSVNDPAYHVEPDSWQGRSPPPLSEVSRFVHGSLSAVLSDVLSLRFACRRSLLNGQVYDGFEFASE